MLLEFICQIALTSPSRLTESYWTAPLCFHKVYALCRQIPPQAETMLKVLLPAVFFVALLSGCSSPVRDARGQSEICEVHHAFMHAMTLPGPKSSIKLPDEYLAAEFRTFPHCMPDYPPDNRHKVLLYICDDCVRAQRAWKRDHPGVGLYKAVPGTQAP